MEELARRLREARRAQGLSKEEASEKLCITLASLEAYEAGLRVPRDEVKLRMSKLYDVPVPDLF